MNNLSLLHQNKIREVADDYKARGYKVFIEPNVPDLPEFLTEYHPDLIAVGPKDSVVVEVKIGAKTAVSDRYREIAEQIQKRSGWRFSLVVVDPQTDEIVPATQPLLSREEIEGRLKNAEELISEKVYDTAFILLWISVEALLRQIASREGLPLERVPSSALFKELFSLGILSQNDFEIVRSAFSIRNTIMHGFEASDYILITKNLAQIARQLLAELDRNTN